MRLITFNNGNGAAPDRLGALVEQDMRIVDFAAADNHHSLQSMLALMDAGDAGLDRARGIVAGVGGSTPDAAVLSRDTVRLMAPLPIPRSLRDSLLFEAHYKRAFEQIYRRIAADEPDPDAAYAAYKKAGKCGPPPHWYDRPTFRLCNHLAVVGPDTEIRWPSISKEMDFELELGCVIGGTGHDISPERAGEYIFGYTILNDFSARDVQRHNIQTGQGGGAASKDFDTGYALGPCIVTIDEIGDPYALTMLARVNGEEWSRGHSGTMYHRFEDLIAAISIDTTLYPGEVIGSGTVGGGCGLELDRFLEEGDTVELEIEKIGVLSNQIRHPKSG